MKSETKKDKKEDLQVQGKRVRELEKRNKELEAGWKRAVADYQNLQKRVSSEKEQLVRLANEALLEEILPVLDNLETVLQHIKDTGLEITVNQFRDVLRRVGVEEIDLLKKDFDPHLAEAVDVVEGDENKVAEVVKKGYLYNDKVIRPAKVKVGKKKIN